MGQIITGFYSTFPFKYIWWIILVHCLVWQCSGNPIEELQHFDSNYRFPREAYPDPTIFAATLESPSRSFPGSKFQPLSQYIDPQQQAPIYNKNYPAIFNSGRIIFNEDYDEPLAPRPNFPMGNLGSFFPPRTMTPNPDVKPPRILPTIPPTSVDKGKVGLESMKNKVKDQGSDITFPKSDIQKKRPNTAGIAFPIGIKISTPRPVPTKPTTLPTKPTSRRPLPTKSTTPRPVPTKPKAKVTAKPPTTTTLKSSTTTTKVSIVEQPLQERPDYDSDEALIEGSIYTPFKAAVKN